MSYVSLQENVVEQRLNLSDAEKALANILTLNARNNWAGIDRSPAAIRKRRQALAWALANETLEGYPAPQRGSLFARTLEHQILGDITGEQAKEIDDILLGIA